jgi:hypothetical protein
MARPQQLGMLISKGLLVSMLVYIGYNRHTFLKRAPDAETFRQSYQSQLSADHIRTQAQPSTIAYVAQGAAEVEAPATREPERTFGGETDPSSARVDASRSGVRPQVR